MSPADGKWTVETLREHLAALAAASDKLSDERAKAVSEQFRAQKEAVAEALSATNREVIQARATLEKRFEGVNEFRAALADQQRTLMPRSEAELAIKALTEKIAAITGQHLENYGASRGIRSGWETAIAVVGLILTVLSIVVLIATIKIRTP